MAKAETKKGNFAVTVILVMGIIGAAAMGGAFDEDPEAASAPPPIASPTTAPSPPPADPEAWRSEPWRADALAEITANRFVRDAIFAAPGSLWVGVADDGSRRDGLAETTCLDLQAAGMPAGETVVIRVIDFYAMLREEMVTLGEHVCD